MGEIKISVVIPCYNCENWVSNTIESLLIQNNKDFEIIFIDDGSKDNSKKVVEEKMSKSSIKYKIISKENEGVSIARNIGIKEAVGEFIYFLDADDYVEPSFLDKTVKVLKNKELDMLFFHYKTIKEGREIFSKKKYKNISVVQKGEKLLEDILNYKYDYHMCAFLVKKDIIVKNSITFYNYARYGEDHEFMIKCLSVSKRVMVIEDILFNYFMQENSVMHKFTLNRLDSIESAIRVKDYINRIYCDENMRSLSKKYVADKMIFNLMSYGRMMDKANDKEVEKKLLGKIRDNKEYLKYFGYKTGSIKQLIYRKLSYNYPKLFIYLMHLTKGLRQNN